MSRTTLRTQSLLQVVFFSFSFAALAISQGNCQEQDSQSLKQYGHSLNWESDLKMDKSRSLGTVWDAKVGDGRSQVVGQGGKIYVATGSAEKDKRSRLTTNVTCYDLKDGNKNWAYQLKSEMSDEQETFGGATASPQATPLIVRDRLIFVTFTGQIVCLNRSDGELVWKKDLVRDLGAEPVQFGFSASPVTFDDDADQLCLLAAGEKAGFYSLNADNGSIVWKANCESSSYCTPVAANIGDIDQWVVVNEKEVFAVSRSEGKPLWKYKLPAADLTNVPTPLVIGDARILISGQGCKGTRCIRINRQDDDWQVNEEWFTRKVQLFYTNWVKIDERIVVGCTDKFMAALDVADGRVLGRWRGFGNGNVALSGENLLVIDGNGNLNVMETAKSSDSKKITGLRVIQKFNVLNSRCWTPLSIIGNKILIRGDDQLSCLASTGNTNTGSLENLISAAKQLEFESADLAETKVDPVEQIFGTFEREGQDAALKLYTKLRKGEQLDEAARIALASSAKEQGLVEVVQLIISHAREDFPDSKEITSAAKALLGKN